MRPATTCSMIGALTLIFASGCLAPNTQSFLHQSHRQSYSIQSKELKALQFYVSEDVLAMLEGANEAESRSVLVPRETPGVVTAVGPYWLIVSFREGSEVPFVADTDGRDQLYYLGTAKVNEDGFEKLADTGQKILRQDGVDYRLVYGESCHLLVDRDQLSELVESRKIEGRVLE